MNYILSFRLLSFKLFNLFFLLMLKGSGCYKKIRNRRKRKHDKYSLQSILFFYSINRTQKAKSKIIYNHIINDYILTFYISKTQIQSSYIYLASIKNIFLR